MMFKHAKLLLLAALGLSLLVSLGANRINPYVLFILYDIGINIILAVSLNLINGYTGQFSLGHAGFMAVGAYTAAVVTNQFSTLNPAASSAVFFSALLAGGLLAAVAGLLVGLPTLRLKGDYLAIVTLGFGEIIRVVFQNLDRVGGARGLAVRCMVAARFVLDVRPGGGDGLYRHLAGPFDLWPRLYCRA